MEVVGRSKECLLCVVYSSNSNNDVTSVYDAIFIVHLMLQDAKLTTCTKILMDPLECSIVIINLGSTSISKYINSYVTK